MARSLGRTGYRWRKAREAILSESRICHLCGHGGSNDVDHHPVPLWRVDQLGLDPCDLVNLRPAHGSNSRCPVCDLCCNQSKGSRRNYQPPIVHSRVW